MSDQNVGVGKTPSLHITIRNCNSIDEASISLRPHSLNIKYGPNGIGKSTIARALTLRAAGDGGLDELMPFKYRAVEGGPRPTVEGADTIARVLTFNDDYVSQFVFQRDEVLKNSFEVFINTEEYQKGNAQIEQMFEALKHTFSEQADFNEALSGFMELRDAFNLTKGGGVAKNSKGYKALGVGGRLKNVPEDLQGYREFLDSDDPAGWITWQSKGKSYLSYSDNCPFCSVPSLDKATAARVSEVYESTAVKHMSFLRSTIDRLGRYFEPGYLRQIEELTNSIAGISPEQELLLVTLRGQIETLLQKLTALQSLSFHALRDEQNVAAALSGLKIDLELLHALRSDATRVVVEVINVKIDDVAEKIDEIRRQIGVQKSRVASLIRMNQEDINEFLRSAGYRYSVCIEPKGDSYRMLLEHEDAPGHIEAASTHLSYGERNAFALVLFMHQVQHEMPDLVVFDDPVSSFDRTKKFAILHQLFHGRKGLRGVTSLLLTHDIEPAIDIVRSGTSRQFTAVEPVVHFLSGRTGRVVEKPITSADIDTFSRVCEANIGSASDSLVKCIYLRRLFEVHGSRGVEYDLLSSLLHAREVPTRKSGNGGDIPLDATEILEAADAVRKYIGDFDYDRLIAEIKRPGEIKARFEATSVGYEKVQLFRLMLTMNPVLLKGDDVFTKFVNETYHIENEYVMQLDPRRFDMVPEYVVATCTALVQSLAAPK